MGFNSAFKGLTDLTLSNRGNSLL